MAAAKPVGTGYESTDLDLATEISRLRADFNSGIKDLHKRLDDWRKDCAVHGERTTRLEERQATIREVLANGKAGRRVLLAAILTTCLGLLATGYWGYVSFREQVLTKLAAVQPVQPAQPPATPNP